MDNPKDKEKPNKFNPDKYKYLAISKFQIKNIKFNITKLSPMAGFELFEKIRYVLASRSAEMEMPSDPLSISTLVYKIALSIDPVIVKEIRETIFENVQFSGDSITKGYAQLSGLEDVAFETLEPMHIYEVLGRGLVVNFFGSFVELILRFQKNPQDIDQSIPKI